MTQTTDAATVAVTGDASTASGGFVGPLPRRLLACCDDPSPVTDLPGQCGRQCEPACETCWTYCTACGTDLSDELVAALGHRHDLVLDLDLGPEFGVERVCTGCGLRFCRDSDTNYGGLDEPAAEGPCERAATVTGQGDRCTGHQLMADGEFDECWGDDDGDLDDEWPDPEGMAFYTIEPNPEYL